MSFTDKILCCDLIEEKLRFIQLAESVDITIVAFDFRNFGGILCMIHYQFLDPGYIIHIWSLSVEDNWIKLMSIPHPEGVWFDHKSLKPVCLTKDGQVLMRVIETDVSDNPFYLLFRHFRKHTWEFCLFSPEDKKFRKFEIDGIEMRSAKRFHPEITYTESLVSLIRLKYLSDSGPLSQSVTEMARTKKHLCNIMTKCDHLPRINWKLRQMQDGTMNKVLNKISCCFPLGE